MIRHGRRVAWRRTTQHEEHERGLDDVDARDDERDDERQRSSPRPQPAAAAKAATARKASRTPRMRRGCRSRPPLIATRLRRDSTTPIATDPPTSAARTIGGGWTTASRRAGANRAACRPRSRAGRRPCAKCRATRGVIVSGTSVTSPSRIRQARTLGAPGGRVRLVIAERHEEVQGLRVEREADVGRRRARPACGCASGRSPRTPRRHRRSRSSGGAGPRDGSRSDTARPPCCGWLEAQRRAAVGRRPRHR